MTKNKTVQYGFNGRVAMKNSYSLQKDIQQILNKPQNVMKLWLDGIKWRNV